MNRANIFLFVFIILLFTPFHGISQILKFRVKEVDSAYLHGTDPVKVHRSYPDLLVSYDVDKQRITIYKSEVEDNIVYDVFDYREWKQVPDSVDSGFKLKGVDNNNQECNINIYILKETAVYDWQIQFLYTTHIAVLDLKKIE